MWSQHVKQNIGPFTSLFILWLNNLLSVYTLLCIRRGSNLEYFGTDIVFVFFYQKCLATKHLFIASVRSYHFYPQVGDVIVRLIRMPCRFRPISRILSLHTKATPEVSAPITYLPCARSDAGTNLAFVAEFPE